MLVVELVELKLVLFPHCLAERQCDPTLTNRIKYRMCYPRPVTVFLIALTATFLPIPVGVAVSLLELNPD
jgi:hypothetical protein